MDSLTTFELRGHFGGFFRTLFGKRRMILRCADQEHELKLPKELRQEFASALIPGVEIAVHGHERLDESIGRIKRIVSSVTFLATPALEARTTCTIRVCAKKNCWKQGGKELWRSLESEIADQGLGLAVRLKAVGCLDNCKRAPNIEYHRQLHERCSADEAGRIIAECAGLPAIPAGISKEPC